MGQGIDNLGNVLPLEWGVQPDDPEFINTRLRHPAGHFAMKRLVEPPVRIPDTEPLA